MDYVLGFLFRSSRRQVALIRKTKPKWQAGKLNGVGGKIEEGETATEAMRREFREETGHDSEIWGRFGTMVFSDGTRVFCFRNWLGDIARLENLTDEKVDWFATSGLGALDILPNLRWLVPMAACESVPSAGDIFSC